MPVRRLSDGRWVADFYTVDRSSGKDGKRVRKKFATKSEALAFENYTLQKFDESPWLAERKETRKLSDLVQLWFDRHGITLNDGEKRRKSMLWASECMGSPLATEFNSQLFTIYRAKRLDGQFARTKRISKVSPRTMNLDHAYFLAVFNELKRLGKWVAPNPLENVRQFRTDETEMAYLTGEQIGRLLAECRNSSAPDLEMIAKICLSTGARWGEAEKLRRSQIAAGKVTFVKTKGKRNRTIPLSPDLVAQLPKKIDSLFTPCYYAFRNALERADIELPSGQLTHVLRYAHFAPDHLEEACLLNPLAKIS